MLPTRNSKISMDLLCSLLSKLGQESKGDLCFFTRTQNFYNTCYFTSTFIFSNLTPKMRLILGLWTTSFAQDPLCSASIYVFPIFLSCFTSSPCSSSQLFSIFISWRSSQARALTCWIFCWGDSQTRVIYERPTLLSSFPTLAVLVKAFNFFH